MTLTPKEGSHPALPPVIDGSDLQVEGLQGAEGVLHRAELRVAAHGVPAPAARPGSRWSGTRTGCAQRRGRAAGDPQRRGCGWPRS
jgi:hypothetical protein